ncbi:MAG: SDR family oxidoreductase [Actinobacteria bacterium]|nr:SDR family oxidoreductase [Actinomycetota bacterium]
MSRRVLVTGAASGLGRAIAAAAAGAGWRVLLTDLDGDAARRAAAELAAATGVDVRPLALDVRDEQAWDAAVTTVRDAWGGLDVLVNNAGVAAGGRIDHLPLEDWQWIVDINVLGAVRGCRAFVPLLKEQGSGHVVNVASLAGLLHPPFMASYNVTKAGVVALSETLRAELEPYGIATTCVCPGFFPTDLGTTLRSPDPAVHELTAKLMASSDVTADDVAAMVLEAVEDGTFLVLTERAGRIAYGAKRFAPWLFRRQVATATGKLRRRIEGSPA